MDGFQSYTPQPAVTMGNFVSTLLQLKSQVELMDQFLSIYVPEYVQLKNYATEYQQANLFGAPFPGTVPPSMPDHVMSSFVVDQGAANPKAEEDTNATTGKGKVRRKQALAKKPAATNNPANLKRRGRKRKYPLPNPNEDSVETTQHVPPTVQLPENFMKASAPVSLPATVTPAHTSNENNLNNQPSPTESSSSAVNQNHHGSSTSRTVSGLDVLAAVSFVLKQQDMNVLSGARDVPSNSGTRNENTSEKTGYDGGLIQEIKQEPIEQNDQEQDYDESHHQVYDVIPGAEVRVEDQESGQTLLQMHNQPQYQKHVSDHLGPLTQQSASSSLPHISQNPQEYVIVGPAEHEVVL